MALTKYRLTADGEALRKLKADGKAKGKISKGQKVYYIDTLTDEQAGELAGQDGKACQFVEPVSSTAKPKE